MRVTNNMIMNNMLRNLNAGLRRMEKRNDHLSTGKALRVPSDNPGLVTRSMHLWSQLTEIEQYSSNGYRALGWLEATDTALGQMGDVLGRARDLAVYGATGSLSPTDREALAEEVDSLFHQLVQIGNAAFGGRYLFAGHKTDQPPYAMQSSYTSVPPYEGDGGAIEVEVAPSVRLQVNVTGDRVVSPLLTALMDLREALRNDDPVSTGGEILGELDRLTDDLLRARAEVGARSNRVEAGLHRLGDLELNVTRTLSETEDVDVARTIMELKMEENVYRLALASTARIIQPTLLDFLR